MRIVPIRLALIGGAALALAACSGGPAAPASGLPTVPPVPSVEVPSVELPSIEIPSIGLPTTPPDVNPDAALEDLYPDDIAGNALDPVSGSGEGVYDVFSNTDTAEFDQFLTDLGASIDQVSAALSFNIWPGPTEGDFTGLTIGAIRVQGVAGTDTLVAFTELVRNDVENAEIGTTTMGGKSVTSVSNPDDPEQNLYLYSTGDVVFMVGGTPAHVEETFTKLP
jgi:hypothetical protein